MPRTAFAPAPSSSHGHRMVGQRSAYRRTSNVNTFLAIDDTTISLALDPAFSDMSAVATLTPPSGVTPIQDFEPVLNTGAASSFFIIAVVFTLLQLRINSVSSAAKRRTSALEALRKVESLQLSALDADRPTEVQVSNAKSEYENALREEMGLRTIIPGVRIVAPNDPKRDEEERANAERFLGWGSDEFGDDEEEIIDRKNNLELEERNGNAGGTDDTKSWGMSGAAQLVLLGTASMLIVLLWTLSFDPLVADQVFTTLGGNPPSNMPLSSW